MPVTVQTSSGSISSAAVSLFLPFKLMAMLCILFTYELIEILGLHEVILTLEFWWMELLMKIPFLAYSKGFCFFNYLPPSSLLQKIRIHGIFIREKKIQWMDEIKKKKK